MQLVSAVNLHYFGSGGEIAVWKKAAGLRVLFLLPQVFLEDSELLCDTRINDFCVEHIKERQRFNRVTTCELFCSNCPFGTACFSAQLGYTGFSSSEFRVGTRLQ